MAKIVGKMLGMVGYGTGGTGTNNWAADMEANLRKIDGLLQAGAAAIQNAPPGSPIDGQVYVVGTAPTGAWATHANEIARYNGTASAWEFFAPAAGWWIAVGTNDYRYSGTAWVAGWTPIHGASHHATGSDPIQGQQLAGLLVTSTPTFAGHQIQPTATNGDVGYLNSAGSLRLITRWNDANDRYEVITRNDDGSSRATRLQIPRSSSLPTSIFGALSVSSDASFGTYVDAVDSYRIGGVSCVTATREGRFTGMRLTNFSSGQIPVCSDGNGQITASGQTDDGTFLGISRTIRAWNSMARSGLTWSDLQWTQDAQERVSMFSSNGSGSGGYHTLAMVPADAETTGRGLGGFLWGQKVSGKSGINPGIKAAIYADSIGAGGSVGGFGAKLKIRYRPDNGNDLVDALRIGAFGSSTADAVETAILLRANAGLNVGGLASAGALVADSAGAVSVVGTPAFTKFGGLASDPIGDYVERSVLPFSAAKRLIPANTVNTGDELEFVYDFKSYLTSGAIDYRFYIGPDGDRSASFRPALTFTQGQMGATNTNFYNRARVIIRFFNVLGTISARCWLVIEQMQAAGGSGNGYYSVIWSTNWTISYDRAVDRYIDLTVQVGPGSYTDITEATAWATYRRAF